MASHLNKLRRDYKIKDIFWSAKHCRPGATILVHVNDIDEFFIRINKNGDIISLSNKSFYRAIHEKVNTEFKLSPFLKDIILDINDARTALSKADKIQQYYLGNIHKREDDYPLFHFVHKKNRKYWDIKDATLVDLINSIEVLRNANLQMWNEYNKLRDDVFEIHGTCDLSQIISSKRKSETRTKAAVKKETKEPKRSREQLNALMKLWDEQYKDNECWQAMKKSERKKYLLYGSYPVSIDIHLKFRQHVTSATMTLYYFRRKEHMNLGEWTLSPEIRPLYTPDNAALSAYIPTVVSDWNPELKRNKHIYIHVADYFIVERKNEIV